MQAADASLGSRQEQQVYYPQTDEAEAERTEKLMGILNDTDKALGADIGWTSHDEA